MKRTRVVSVLSILTLVGCGGAPRGAAPGPTPVGKVTLVAPAKPVKRPNQARILGTDDHGGSTVLALAAGDQSVRVDSLWVKTEAAHASGGSSVVELTTRPSTSRQIRVGVFEDAAGGAGPAWRAGVWVAATVAVSVLDKDLTDFEFEANAAGHIDGASASALMTAGFIASILGWQVDPAATMTGVINPDGTVGPVGGIPQKFTAALAAGKRRLGYPIGQRQAIDADTGVAVDLVKLARDHDAVAVEIADIFAAVKLLTGKDLPRPVPVAAAAMELDLELGDRLTARGDAWDQRVDALLEHLDDSRSGSSKVVMLAVRARTEHDLGFKHLGQGLTGSGQRHMVEAWIAARAAVAAESILTAVTDGDLAAAGAELHALVERADASLDTVRAIGTRTPGTMGDHLVMMSAFDAAIDSWSFAGFARELAQGLQPRLAVVAELPAEARAAAVRGVAGELVTLTVAAARAEAALTLAGEVADLEAAPSTVYQCSLPNVRRLASSFQAAAGSNLTYVEALAGLSSSYARAAMAAEEPDYMVALVGSRVGDVDGVPRTLKAEWGERSIAWGLFALAASQQSFFRSSSLVSRWYSLGVGTGYDGRASSVRFERAFVNMLDYADQRAREHARAALVATGEIPVQARLHYQTARLLREGGVADKLDALEEFWAASSYAQAAVMLARN